MLRALVIVCFYLNLGFAKNEYYIDDSDGYGRKFDGIGGISGGGVSSEEIKFRHQAISKFYLSIYTASPPLGDYVQVRVSAVLVEEMLLKIKSSHKIC